MSKEAMMSYQSRHAMRTASYDEASWQIPRDADSVIPIRGSCLCWLRRILVLAVDALSTVLEHAERLARP